MIIEAIKEDFLDIGKVNGISFGAIGISELVQQVDVFKVNDLIQSTGNSIIILLAVGYTLVKFVKIFREMRWDKEDRDNETSEE